MKARRRTLWVTGIQLALEGPARAVGERQCEIPRLRLFLFVASCPPNQFARSGKRYAALIVTVTDGQRASIAIVRCPGLLGPAPSQLPQSARREHKGEAPQPAERPEYPDEEKAAGGFGDLAVMCPPHVDDGHSCCEQSDEQHDDVPRSPFREHERPVQDDREDEQRSV